MEKIFYNVVYTLKRKDGKTRRMFAMYDNFKSTFEFYKRALERDCVSDIIILKYHQHSDHTECTMLEDGSPF